MRNYTVHKVGIGDTIQSIGLTYGVDWTKIVELNGLEYPYVDDTIEANEYEKLDSVAKVGSSLVIPTTGIGIPEKANLSSKELEKYSFGSDLDIFLYRDQKVVNLEDTGRLSSSDASDVQLSEGLRNLHQQLTVKLGTQKGALLPHPEFGSDLVRYIGQKVTPELLTKIKLEVKECLLEDFRVESVGDITVMYKNHAVYVECVIYPIKPFSAFTYSHSFSN